MGKNNRKQTTFSVSALPLPSHVSLDECLFLSSLHFLYLLIRASHICPLQITDYCKDQNQHITITFIKCSAIANVRYYRIFLNMVKWLPRRSTNNQSQHQFTRMYKIELRNYKYETNILFPALPIHQTNVCKNTHSYFLKINSHYFFQVDFPYLIPNLNNHLEEEK